MAKAVFNAAPKDEEKKHIAEQVKPASVDEHGCEHRNQKIDQAGDDDGPVRCGIPGRYQAESNDKLIDRGAQGEFIGKHRGVERDESEGRKPEGLAPNVVVQWNHERCILTRLPFWSKRNQNGKLDGNAPSSRLHAPDEFLVPLTLVPAVRYTPVSGF